MTVIFGTTPRLNSPLALKIERQVRRPCQRAKETRDELVKHRAAAAAAKAAAEPQPLEPEPPPLPIYIPPARTMLTEVAKAHNMTLHDMLGPRRARQFVLARREAMWTLFSKTRLSVSWIAEKMGRDHTTIIHGLRRHIKDNGLELPEHRKFELGN